jgi:hypothetical protein
MCAKQFLKEQATTLFIAVVSTAITIYFGISLVRSLTEGIDISDFSGVRNTTKGLSDPHSSIAFGMVLFPMAAIVCWWSILSEWKAWRSKENSEELEKKKSNKADMATPRKPSD